MIFKYPKLAGFAIHAGLFRCVKKSIQYQHYLHRRGEGNHFEICSQLRERNWRARRGRHGPALKV